jgi:hypothetical protein
VDVGGDGARDLEERRHRRLAVDVDDELPLTGHEAIGIVAARRRNWSI